MVLPREGVPTPGRVLGEGLTSGMVVLLRRLPGPCAGALGSRGLLCWPLACAVRVFGGQTMAFGKGQFGANRTSGAAVKNRVVGSGGRALVLLKMSFDESS